MGKFVYCHLNDLEAPRNGEVLVNRWWMVMPGKGAAFWNPDEKMRHFFPQCNNKEDIASKLRDDLMPDANVVLVHVAFVGHDMRCGGKLYVPEA